MEKFPILRPSAVILTLEDLEPSIIHAWLTRHADVAKNQARAEHAAMLREAADAVGTIWASLRSPKK